MEGQGSCLCSRGAPKSEIWFQAHDRSISAGDGYPAGRTWQDADVIHTLKPTACQACLLVGLASWTSHAQVCVLKHLTTCAYVHERIWAGDTPARKAEKGSRTHRKCQQCIATISRQICLEYTFMYINMNIQGRWSGRCKSCISQHAHSARVSHKTHKGLSIVNVVNMALLIGRDFYKSKSFKGICLGPFDIFAS